MAEDTGKALADAYRRAGSDFLAYNLERLFRHIATEQDKASHNNMLEEVMLMVGDEPKNVFQRLAETMLKKRTQEKKRRSFIKMVADILRIEAKG